MSYAFFSHFLLALNKIVNNKELNINFENSYLATETTKKIFLLLKKLNK